jgi:hypothetical protein
MKAHGANARAHSNPNGLAHVRKNDIMEAVDQLVKIKYKQTGH